MADLLFITNNKKYCIGVMADGVYNKAIDSYVALPLRRHSNVIGWVEHCIELILGIGHIRYIRGGMPLRMRTVQHCSLGVFAGDPAVMAVSQHIY